MPSTNTKTSAEIEIGRRHPYAVLLGPGMFGFAVLAVAIAVVVFGVRWLFGHLSAPSVHVPTPNASGVPLGWIALALVASVAAVLIVRRIVRRFRYGV